MKLVEIVCFLVAEALYVQVLSGEVGAMMVLGHRSRAVGLVGDGTEGSRRRLVVTA